MSMQLHLKWQASSVSRDRREAFNHHRACALWFTGLSGAGKSTIARAVEEQLCARGSLAYALDGDNMRHGLCADLTFSESDRRENVRRVGEVAKLFVDAGFISIVALISPHANERDSIRESMRPGDFIEIYCKASLATCEIRDPKGFYKRARRGEIRNYTGISSSYEAPEKPELVLDTERLTVEECVDQVITLLDERMVFMEPLRRMAEAQ